MAKLSVKQMKIGRPILSNVEKKGRVTGVRFRNGERELLQKVADSQKKKLSEWMRTVLIEAAKKYLETQAALPYPSSQHD